MFESEKKDEGWIPEASPSKQRTGTERETLGLGQVEGQHCQGQRQEEGTGKGTTWRHQNKGLPPQEHHLHWEMEMGLPHKEGRRSRGRG